MFRTLCLKNSKGRGLVEYEDIDSYRIDGNRYCIADEMIESGIKVGKSEYRSCGSSDAMSVYENTPNEGEDFYTGYCYSCSQSFPKEAFHNSSHASDFGVEGGVVTEKKTFERKPTAQPITKEEVMEVMGYETKTEAGYSYNGGGIRGIKDEYNQFFGHVTKLDKQGNPRVRFYPETRDGKLTGYKSRTFPKSFGWENKGQTGIKNDLSGQVKFKDMHFRDIVICGGEEDKVAFFQQFSDYQKKRFKDSDQEYAPMPVVSPTTGEGSALKQIRDQYDFINRAERIFIGFDADGAGVKAAQEVAEIFPKEKVFIINWSFKDPNGAIYNAEGKDYSAQTIRDFFNAKPYFSNGIVTSQEADCLIEEELLRPKMSLPPFMSDLQKKMAGGIPLGYIVNWIAETGEIAPCSGNITR